MAVNILTKEQKQRYMGDLSSEQLTRYFSLSDSDRVVIAERLGDHNRQDFVLKTPKIDISMSACRDLRDHRSADVD